MKHFLFTLCALVTFLGLSGKAAASLRVEDVARQFFPEDYDTLLVGDKSVPILYSESTLPLARGVIVILVSEGNQALNLASASELAKQLNDKGWHTLISPSLLVSGTPSQASETAAPDSGDENTDGAAATVTTLHPMQDSLTPAVNFEASKTQTTLLMGVISNHISSHKGFRIVIASGMTAAQVLSAANDGTIAPPDSLVTLVPFWPQRKVNENIPRYIAQSGFPILDISLPDVNPWEAMTTAERSHAAKTALKLQYRQRRLGSMSTLTATGQAANTPFVNWLSSEIYGWISHLGW